MRPTARQCVKNAHKILLELADLTAGNIYLEKKILEAIELLESWNRRTDILRAALLDFLEIDDKP